LPVSSASLRPPAGRKTVTISRDSLMVGGELVRPLDHGVLVGELQLSVERRPTMVIADADTPFRTLSRVLGGLAAGGVSDTALLVRNGGFKGSQMMVPLEPIREGPASGPVIVLRSSGYAFISAGGAPTQVEDEGELVRLVHEAGPGGVVHLSAAAERPVQELVRLMDLLRADHPRVALQARDAP
jgi:hypothetical protein